MRNCVVVGGGGHAKVVISVVKRIEGYRMVGYLDPVDKGFVLGLPYLGNDDRLADVKRQHTEIAAVIGIGFMRSSEHRTVLRSLLQSLGYALPSIVARGAMVNEDVEIGQGTVVLDGAVVNTSAVIGQFGIINTNSTIEHDCVIGDSVHVAPSAVLCGGVRVGDGCLIGAGAQIIEGITVCDSCVVGAGSTVIRDIIEPGTYAGSPARRIA